LHRRMSFSLGSNVAGSNASLASLIQKHQFKMGYYDQSSEGETHTPTSSINNKHSRHNEQQNWILEFDGYDPKTEGIREALLTLGNGVFATRGACEMSSSSALNTDGNSSSGSGSGSNASKTKDESMPPPVTTCHYAGTYFNGYFNRSDSKVSDRYITNEDLVNFPNWLPISFRILGEKVAEARQVVVKSPTATAPRQVKVEDAEDITTTAATVAHEPATTLQPTTQEFVENQQEEQKQLQQELIEHLKHMATSNAQLQLQALDKEQQLKEALLKEQQSIDKDASTSKQQVQASEDTASNQWITLENCKRIDKYKQWLNLKEGVLYRRVTLVDHKDRITTITTRRFVHMGSSHVGCIDFAITPENWSGEFHVRCSIDASVCNNGVARYRNLNPYHFDTVDVSHERVASATDTIASATVLTRQSHIEVATAQRVRVFMNEIRCTPHEQYTINEARNVIHCDLKLLAPPLPHKFVKHGNNGNHGGEIEEEEEGNNDYDDDDQHYGQYGYNESNGDAKPTPAMLRARESRTFHIEKVCALVGSKDFGITNVKSNAVQVLRYIPNFEILLNQHKTAWEMLWTRMDTIITPVAALEEEENTVAKGGDEKEERGTSTRTETTTATTKDTTKTTETKEQPTAAADQKGEEATKQTTSNNKHQSIRKQLKAATAATVKHKPIIEQIILRLHTFHCLQVLSTNSLDRDVSVPARGIHGESYRGHIFWDELYIMPFFTTKLPEVARLIPKYRYKRINMARINAIKKGFHGALFPWQSGSDGQEETQQIHLNPMTQQWGPDLSSAQYHGNIAIAYNILRYFDLTRDVGFMEDFGAEIVLEIAKMFASMARYNHETERYDIVGVMGPDEYHESFPGSSEQGLRNNAVSVVLS